MEDSSLRDALERMTGDADQAVVDALHDLGDHFRDLLRAIECPKEASAVLRAAAIGLNSLADDLVDTYGGAA